MDSSNLSALPEDSSPEEAGIDPSSAFSPAAIPPRPASQSSLQKYSPSEWSSYFDKEEDVTIPGSNDVFHSYLAGSEGPVVFCLHGGGYSGLSFALSASKIKEKARVVAMDLRGHGKSSTDNDSDLSIETLCNDVLAVLKTMYGDTPPAIILVGHSMGGSVAVHVAAKKVISNVLGLVVVDVVEGTAMASLVHMQKILSSRVQYFRSIEKAVEWTVKGGHLRNVESARLSVPSTLKYDDSKKCYIYRTPLDETESYWKGWYEGLSEIFLSCPVPKLLLLAGTDRLDRSLTIGQMQGKFQVVVVRHTGHAIQEDVPEEFASFVLNLILAIELALMVLRYRALFSDRRSRITPDFSALAYERFSEGMYDTASLAIWFAGARNLGNRGILKYCQNPHVPSLLCNNSYCFPCLHEKQFIRFAVILMRSSMPEVPVHSDDGVFLQNPIQKLLIGITRDTKQKYVVIIYFF